MSDIDTLHCLCYKIRKPPSSHHGCLTTLSSRLFFLLFLCLSQVNYTSCVEATVKINCTMVHPPFHQPVSSWHSLDLMWCSWLFVVAFVSPEACCYFLLHLREHSKHHLEKVCIHSVVKHFLFDMQCALTDNVSKIFFSSFCFEWHTGEATIMMRVAVDDITSGGGTIATGIAFKDSTGNGKTIVMGNTSSSKTIRIGRFNWW